MIGDPPYLNVWIQYCNKIFLYKKKAQLSRTGLGNQHGEQNVILTHSKSRHIHPLEFLCCCYQAQKQNSNRHMWQPYAYAGMNSPLEKYLRILVNKGKVTFYCSNVAGSCFVEVYFKGFTYLVWGGYNFDKYCSWRYGTISNINTKAWLFIWIFSLKKRWVVFKLRYNVKRQRLRWNGTTFYLDWLTIFLQKN